MEIARRWYGRFRAVPFIGEFIIGKVSGKAEMILGVGADFQLGMTGANCAAKDAEEESRDNQKRKKAFHRESANTIILAPMAIGTG